MDWKNKIILPTSSRLQITKADSADKEFKAPVIFGGDFYTASGFNNIRRTREVSL
jgi:hypothetical protein